LLSHDASAHTKRHPTIAVNNNVNNFFIFYLHSLSVNKKSSVVLLVVCLLSFAGSPPAGVVLSAG
ncbi:MAG: hypothetical protein J5781_07800, partial [Clostridia bacterium]|nr:hypothetical protein [Clostridia bacterium]